MSPKSMISEDQKIAAEEQIRSLRKEIDYNTRDYSIDFLIQQFRDDEFYIPDEYQRQYIWNNADKNRFVESILLGLCNLRRTAATGAFASGHPAEPNGHLH